MSATSHIPHMMLMSRRQTWVRDWGTICRTHYSVCKYEISEQTGNKQILPEQFLKHICKIYQNSNNWKQVYFSLKKVQTRRKSKQPTTRQNIPGNCVCHSCINPVKLTQESFSIILTAGYLIYQININKITEQRTAAKPEYK